MPVITVTATAATVTGIAGGILVFGDPLRGQRLRPHRAGRSRSCSCAWPRGSRPRHCVRSAKRPDVDSRDRRRRRCPAAGVRARQRAPAGSPRPSRGGDSGCRRAASGVGRRPAGCGRGSRRRARAAGRGGRSRHRGLTRAALLRVRRRRHVAGRHGGRLDDLGLGPERGPRGALAGRRCGRGGVRGLARRPARTAGRARASASSPAGRWRTRTCLAAARHAVLRDAGWDVEERGLVGAPRRRRVRRRARRTSTIFSSLRLLGLGARARAPIPADDQGRMRADALAAALDEGYGPGDRVRAGGQRQHRRVRPVRARSRTPAPRAGAWLHVDGAFGLWAAATPRLRAARAPAPSARDSWATDAHKWLNVPYDCGIAIVRDPAAHRAAMALTAPYFVEAGRGPRRVRLRARDLAPRARVPGLRGAASARAQRRRPSSSGAAATGAREMAAALDAAPGLRVLNDVVLNQVLVRPGRPGARCRR